MAAYVKRSPPCGAKGRVEVSTMDKPLTQEEKLAYFANEGIHTLTDFCQANPGPHDEEAKEKYLKPYLSARESKVVFLHRGCGFTFKDISQRMHLKTPTLRQLWKRTIAKTIKNEQDKQKDITP